ncbi:hypothetical protein FRUB_02923 [Fimbriiglobus ruber]|uniref:Uncharacterized protein n=2 Tax=Fimbriiglobus ruber TaxID=1908690 RepID=A0A225DUJ1_9BACT|nr:hypothetical protein FRUB_02923 [Fimbriiglobus ruber]
MPIPTRQLVLSAVFGAALATASPARAEDSKPAPDATATKDLAKKIDDLKADVAKLQTLRKDFDDFLFGKADGKTSLDTGVLKRLDDLEKSSNSLKESLTRIEKQLAGLGSSTSAFGPGGVPATSRSTVRLVNDYQVEISLIVNGKSHQLNPGETKAVEVPAGEYTYELLAAGGQAVTSKIKAGETVTLRIR